MVFLAIAVGVPLESWLLKHLSCRDILLDSVVAQSLGKGPKPVARHARSHPNIGRPLCLWLQGDSFAMLTVTLSTIDTPIVFEHSTNISRVTSIFLHAHQTSTVHLGILTHHQGFTSA